MGMVFQKIGTLPWKTVMENVELGSKMRGIPKRERREKAQHYIDLVVCMALKSICQSIYPVV